MTDEDCLAGPVHGIEDPRRPVRASRYQLRPRGVEAHVQDLVIVTSERVHALPTGDVPHLWIGGRSARSSLLWDVEQASLA